ncbi:MAG: hypothetical protein QM763_22440 [Agriterribacter sp.]
MAYPNTKLIEALRNTAQRLRKGAHYAWGNHGACNCGNLLEEKLTARQLKFTPYLCNALPEPVV